MPDVSTEVRPLIREDIAQIVGLDRKKIEEIDAKRAQEAEVFRLSRQNGEKAYGALKEGKQVDSVALGVGQFDISPIEKVDDLVPNVERRVQEINPPPPGEHINLYLDSFAQKALEDKNFEAAVACYNYITDEQLTTEENRGYLEKLAQAAVTEDEKYDLYLALKQVIPQAGENEAPQEPPSAGVKAEPEPHEAVIPEPAQAPTPTPTSIETDDEAWKAAAGIPTPEPLTVPAEAKAPDVTQASAALDALPEAPTPIHSETPPPPAATIELPPEMPANVIPFVNPSEKPSGQPEPVTIPQTPIAEVVPGQSPQTSNGQILRPVPSPAEAAAQGLIDNVASVIPSSTTEELAKAA